MRANLFRVDFVEGSPVIVSGYEVALKDAEWSVPLCECFSCGQDSFLLFSKTSPPEVTVDDTDPSKGKIMTATVVNCGDKKKFRRPDENSRNLKALVMLTHFDELTKSDGVYDVIAQGTGIVLEMYRGATVNFRCPQGINRFQLAFSGTSLTCTPLAMDGSPEGSPSQSDLTPALS